jgi:hypothetical protein
VTWGIFIQYFIQFGCSYIDGTASFRLPWGLQMIPGLILAIGMSIFPESPRWLFDQGRSVLALCRVCWISNYLHREDEALRVLADLHGKGDKQNELVILEYEEIKNQVWCAHMFLSPNLTPLVGNI